MKKWILALTLLVSMGCAEMQHIVSQLPQTYGAYGGLTQNQISGGLKQALDIGVDKGITQLAGKDGFFKNELTRILLPKELQEVDNTLRKLGLGVLADEGLKLLNSAAEDAVIHAKPIFKNAIQNITFFDVKNILMGNNTAATSYLENNTRAQLVTAFQPDIQNSLGKVGADKVWTQMISKYNLITGRNINPNLSEYVAEQAVIGVFKVVAQKEVDIRQNIASRSTDLLKKVFALQDNK